MGSDLAEGPFQRLAFADSARDCGNSGRKTAATRTFAAKRQKLPKFRIVTSEFIECSVPFAYTEPHGVAPIGGVHEA